MNTLRRTTIFILALAAGMIFLASPAFAAVSKADRVVLGKINTRAQAFLGTVQANQAPALQVKGQWVARTQENNKACQNALVNLNKANGANIYLPLGMYLAGKQMAVDHTFKSQWVSYFNYLRGLRYSGYMRGTTATLQKSLDSYIRRVAARSIAWPVLIKNMFTVDQLCDAAETWNAAGGTAEAMPQLFKDVWKDTAWLDELGGDSSGWDLPYMMQQIKIPVSVRKLVDEGYIGIPIISYDPVAQAAGDIF